GVYPGSPVVRDTAGNLYGTTQIGGSGGEGVVYKLDAARHVTTLYNFTSTQQLSGGVVRDAAGNLYGSAQNVVFKLDTAGNFTMLASPFNPSPPTLDQAGNVYWTTNYQEQCTRYGCGGIYKLDSAGNITELYNFSEEDLYPTSAVTADAAGNLYGTAGYSLYKLDAAGHFTVLYAGAVGGNFPFGTVVLDLKGDIYGTGEGPAGSPGFLYKFDTAGSFTVLYTFTGGATGGADGQLLSPVVRDSAGNLYGTALGGKRGCAQGWGCGVVYELDADGNYAVLYTFTGGADGATPKAGVLLAPDGNLDGTTYYGGTEGYGVVYRVDPRGNETALYSFSGDNGSGPTSGLMADPSGNLYGTTYVGGAANQGVVYQVDGAGRYAVLHEFSGAADGGIPKAGVVRDAAGNLYGTTATGGSADAGVIFKLDAAGNETVLYNFTGGANGGGPAAGVILDPEGNLYGNAGVIFKLDTAGNYTVLHTFTSGAGGTGASSGVTRDSAGNLYGTTAYGGDLNCQFVGAPAGCGVVYKLDPAGNYTVLHSFAGGSDGAVPGFAGVAVDSDGNLYGTTEYGGKGVRCYYFGVTVSVGCGTVYKVDGSGHETILHRFTGADGEEPLGVTIDSAGGIYGTTFFGGSGGSIICVETGCGVVFEIDTSGQFSVLYSFTGESYGSFPNAGLVRDATGAVFGTFGTNSGEYELESWIGGGVFKLTR
ncbi:MAG: choice-of-anchor tandem repeat GloVer-containing protein, partial [Bryobacteraceae bacterium]